MAETPMEIDDSLYSRQRYVLGDSAMKRMASSSVLLYGAGGLGIEIAKNIVLAGIKSLTVQDPKIATVQDLGTQFFLKVSDVQAGKNRAEASAAHLSELNPYVSIMTKTQPMTEDTDLTYLSSYQCIVLTECPLSVQKKVNDFCRAANPQIKFLSGDVYGIFGSAFCDFGDCFEVFDATGEEPKDIFVSDITKANPGVVSCMDNRMHQLEDGDVVTFREVKGMTVLNGQQFAVKVVNPFTFSICDTSTPDFAAYEGGGIFSEVKVHKTISFMSLEKELVNPSLTTPDLSKFEAPPLLHLGYLTINKFLESKGRLPKQWNENDADDFLALAKEINDSMVNKLPVIDEKHLQALSKCSEGCLTPLCAVFGGVIAQEALKALTGKFTPLKQWLHLDCIELLPANQSVEQFTPRGNRYDSLLICIGEEKLKLLANTNLFMVGCGAIGCEMLKNYALLGISAGSGKVTITDNDLIEKSNLNRQFLFRPHHIQKPKSTTAAQAALDINKDMKIEAQQHKVCPQTEETIYTDAFFEAQNIMVNALDNVEARRYMDGRCVTNQRALMESGTMGTKGHVQVIVPHITESYTSQRDPADEDFPYCTVKSFPATLEHCIQWARDKFEECFVQNAQLFNKFTEVHKDLRAVAQQLTEGSSIDGAVKVSKMLASRPSTWTECVQLARLRFEKYFNHKAKQLLHSFPVDQKLEDGSLFWASPKRPPTPIVFDLYNDTHRLFLVSCAHLYADVFKITWDPQNAETAALEAILSQTSVPAFKPSNKRIVTDESVKKEEDTSQEITSDVIEQAGLRMQQALQAKGAAGLNTVTPVEFEKDDDSNGHIDFIASTTNLRAQMYSIECGDRLKIKKIAGRIVPAIATTTAAVAGLVTLEMIKVLSGAPLEQLRNCFMNLALPIVLLSEPGPVVKTVLREGLAVTIWDKWEIRGSKTFTLQQFIDQCKQNFGFEANSLVQGVKIVFMPFMPGHMKRLNMPMTKLLKPVPDQKYVDLVVSFDGDNDEDVPGPPVRYFF